MIYAHQMQNGRVIVMHMTGIGYNVGAIFVGLAIGNAAFHTCTGEQTAKGLCIVIAAFAVATVTPGSPAKFGADGDESLLQQPALLEVLDERGNSSVGTQRFGPMRFHVAV